MERVRDAVKLKTEVGLRDRVGRPEGRPTKSDVEAAFFGIGRGRPSGRPEPDNDRSAGQAGAAGSEEGFESQPDAIRIKLRPSRGRSICSFT